MNTYQTKKLKEINQTKIISESEIISLKSSLNNNRININDLKIPNNGFIISNQQTIKGLKFLMSQHKSNNNPFGFREIAILEDFKEFRLIGFYDCANDCQKQNNIHAYFPLYSVIAKNRDTFEYYYNFIEISIVG